MRNAFFIIIVILGFIACDGNKKSSLDNESIEEIIFNMTIDSLKESDEVLNVFAHFYFDIDLSVLKKIFKVVDASYTDEELDSLCAVYDYKCSLSIHELINKRNKKLIVYEYPNQDFFMLGYPIMVSDIKVVSIYSHLNHIEPYTYQVNIGAFVFEKKHYVWEIANHVVFSSKK